MRGGAAGVAAALAAARAGADVCLIEARPRLGGTVAHSLIHTLGGFFDAAGAAVNGGLAEELVAALQRAAPSVRPRRLGRTWVLSACPTVYRATVRDWIRRERRITVLTRTRVTGVVHETGTVRELELSGPAGHTRVRTRAVVDATGSSEVARALDAALARDDAERAAGGLIFRLRGVAPDAVAFPKGLGVLRAIRAAVETGALPGSCANVWVDTGVRTDEVYVKIPVPLPPNWRERYGDLSRDARSVQALVVNFLRLLPAFGRARVARTGELGVRDGDRIRGEYCLTADDVRAGAKFPDAVCCCNWPIEFWHPERGVELEYLPDGRAYEIPLRALKVLGVRNLWAAGKCLSADRYAQASARVVGSCWSMGEAAGRAAAAVGAAK